MDILDDMDLTSTDDAIQLAVAWYHDLPVLFLIKNKAEPLPYDTIRKAASTAIAKGRTPAQVAWTFRETVEADGSPKPLVRVYLPENKPI